MLNLLFTMRFLFCYILQKGRCILTSDGRFINDIRNSLSSFCRMRRQSKEHSLYGAQRKKSGIMGCLLLAASSNMYFTFEVSQTAEHISENVHLTYFLRRRYFKRNTSGECGEIEIK